MGFQYIYFYGTEDGAEVKIGKTRQAPGFRLRQHENQAGNYVPMRTLAVVLGQTADEAALKRHFASRRSRSRSREWFTADEELRGYLRWLRQRPFVATNEDDLLRLSAVDASEWLPDELRRTGASQLRLEDTGKTEDPWADLDLDHIAEGDYYTHPKIIEAARAALGEIALDPASCSEANVVVAAQEFYSFHENGLLHDWTGTVWLNPPYGNWDEWAPKALSEWGSGRVSAMCVLATTRVTTALSFHVLVEQADALFIGRGRFRFWGPKAKEPDEGHVVLYFGTQPESFAEAFSPLGSVFFRKAAQVSVREAA